MNESIYQKIKAALGSRESLPEDFSLRGLEMTADPYARDGARDAALFFHERRQPIDTEALFEAFALLYEEDYGEAFALFKTIFCRYSVVRCLPYLGDSLDSLYAEVNPYPLINAFIKVLKYSDDVELVKFALLALEYVSFERTFELKKLVDTLALADELSFFASLAASRRPEADQMIFETAGKVKGWGRIMLIPRLDFADKKINYWLLREGQYNNARNQYNATVILSRSKIPALLGYNDLPEESFRQITRLYLYSLRPEPMLVTFEDLDPELQMALAASWLKAAGNFPLNADGCEVMLRLDDYLQYLLINLAEDGSSAILAEEDELFTPLPDPEIYEPYKEDISFLASLCDGLIDVPLFSAVVFKERGELGLIQMKELMGLPANPAEAFEIVKENPAEQLEGFRYLLEHPGFFNKCLNYFSDKLPLNAMASGPGAKRSQKSLSDDEKVLLEIIICLRFRPWKGREFMLAGLQSSHVNLRLSALLTLKIWLFQTGVPLKVCDNELRGLLRVLEQYETNELNLYYLNEVSMMHVRKR